MENIEYYYFNYYKNAAGASMVTEAMTTSHESICCSEVDRMVEKKEDGSSAVSCIIDHKGFHIWRVSGRLGAANSLLQLPAAL